ncbi:MAG: helix-hairpin-helix domain-containing protein [bacterium]
MIILFFLSVFYTDADIFEAEDNKDYDIVLQDLESLRRNPINLNAADIEELIRIPYLSITDCLKIIDYRKQHGYFTSSLDLLAIPGFDRFRIDEILPYITVKSEYRNIEKLVTRLRARTEIPAKPGSVEYFTKSQCVFGHYNVSFVNEKDPYENSLFDYWASGIIVKQGYRTFALGKYNLDIGSGVVASPLGSFFNSADFRILVKERGILPYTSVLENGGFFGAALSDSLFMNFTLFYSNQKLDGRIDSFGHALSFDFSGEHTDSAGLAHKDRISEEVIGYNIQYRFQDVLIANRTYFCSYVPSFICSDSLNDFYGESFWITGIGMKYYSDELVIFSELARTNRDRVGGLFGCSGFVPYFDIQLAGKYFPAGFYSPKGIEAEDNYYGGVLNINNHSKYLDLGATLTLDSKLDEDSVKYGFRVNAAKSLGVLYAKFQVRLRYTSRALDLSGSRVFIRIKPVKQLFFDLRLEERYVFEPDTVEKGIFGGLEMGIDMGRIRFRGRYGIFKTDSYASRLFVYEADLPGIITNRMLYYQGDCGFLHLTVRPVDFLKLTCKYSTVKRDTLRQQQIGAQVDITLR